MGKNFKIQFVYLLSVSMLFAFVFLGEHAFAETLAYGRLYGTDRYKTAVEISRAGWQSAENVVLATGENFPDALCAAPLAKQLNAPILLAEKYNLNADTENEINRLKAKNVFIIGGPGVIRESVRAAMESKGKEVVRLWGEDRYETSLNIADYMKRKFKVSSELVAVTGEDFPDALSISSIAAQKGMIMLLIPKDNMPDDIKQFIVQNGFTKTYVAGGSEIISDSTSAQLPNVERIGGIDRFERNISIIKRFADEIKFHKIYIATAEDYPDAIAGSTLAAGSGSPIILTGRNPQKDTWDFIKSKMPDIKEIRALGGEAVVLPYTMNAIISGEYKYYQEIDYDNPQKYILPGRQSNIDDNLFPGIKKELNIQDKSLESIKKVFDWKKNKFKTSAVQEKYVGKIDVNDLIKTKELYGCHDHALVVGSVLREYGFPVVMIDTAGIQQVLDFIEKGTNPGGHVFLEVLMDNKWILLDPTTGEYILDYDRNNPVIPIIRPGIENKGHYVMLKGLDQHDYGVYDIRRLGIIEREYAHIIKEKIGSLKFPEYKIGRF